MEPEKSEASASTSNDKNEPPDANSEKEFEFSELESQHLVAEEVGVKLVSSLKRKQLSSGHQHSGQEQLIQLENDPDNFHILQPQQVSIGDEEGSPEEQLYHGKDNDVFGGHSDEGGDRSNKRILKPQSLIKKEGSSEKRFRYEASEDENDRRYHLQPHEFSIHMGADTDLLFDVHGHDHDNRFILRPDQNVAQDVEQEAPEIQFKPDNVDDDNANDVNRFIFQPGEKVVQDLEHEAPELHLPPDDVGDVDKDADDAAADDADAAAADDDADADDDDDDGSRFILQPGENIAQYVKETPELQFQPEETEDDGNQYINQTDQKVEDIEQVAELQFEPDNPDEDAADDDDDDSHYVHQSQHLAPEADIDVEQESPELRFQPDDPDFYEEDNDDESRYTVSPRNDVQEQIVDYEQESWEEQHYQHVPYGHAVALEDNDVDDNDNRHIESSRKDYEQETHEEYPNTYGSIGEYDDDRHVVKSRNDGLEPGLDYEQKSSETFYKGNDNVDNDGTTRPSTEDHDQICFDDDNNYPKALIQGLLSEGNTDERYSENTYEEENDVDDDENDVDDAIDIRDNTNVEDQFEFEETSYVEAAVGGILDDSDVIAGKKELVEGDLKDEVGVIGITAGDEVVGGDDDVNDDDDNAGIASASTSRVTFSDENILRQNHQYGRYHDDDDRHGAPGFSKQDSCDSDEQYQNKDEDGKSLDVLLLEEICEEAASMTIKEALIHSLKPNVRAGLTTAHLKLSESEILSLEGYCEDFVGGLIKDLLKRSSVLDIESGVQKTVVKTSVIKSTAKQLSAMEVKQLKIYCDHFLHNVIAESIIDSSMIVARQQYQTEQVRELLYMFQNSEELQEYFTNLTTDIVRAALLNVTAKEDLEVHKKESEEKIDPIDYEGTESMEHSSFLVEDQEFEQQEEDFDFDDKHSFGFPLPKDVRVSPEYRGARSQGSWPSEDEREMGTNGKSPYQRASSKNDGRSPSQDAGDTTLEFDMEWAEGVIQDIEANPDGERRQKFVMRELEFDDRANVGGTELLAPVFLAVAEDNEDDNEFVGLRRKTQSIEDLCDLIEEEKEPPRKRASSLTQRPKKKPRAKPRPVSYHEQMEELRNEALKEPEDIPDTSESEDYAESEEEITSESRPEPTSDKQFYAYDDERYRWHTIRVNNREKVLDLKLIEPYMKVITHGGVHMPSRAVIVVIAACYLPNKTTKNYEFLMEQLFFYLISTLELLATTDEYYLVYFNGGTSPSNQPALPWMKRFYQHIEGGLKKNMIKMFIVHPNFWLKTVIRVAKAFVGTNFWSKLYFIKSLDELSTKIPVEFMYIPDEVIRADPKYKRVHNL